MPKSGELSRMSCHRERDQAYESIFVMVVDVVVHLSKRERGPVSESSERPIA